MPDVIERLSACTFKRLAYGNWEVRVQQVGVDIYGLIHLIQLEARDAVRNGGAIHTRDLYAVVSQSDYHAIVESTSDMDFSIRSALPNPPIDSIAGIPLRVDRYIEPGYVYLRSEASLTFTARFEIPMIEPKPSKPDNSPSLGGQKSDLTGDEPMLGGKSK